MNVPTIDPDTLRARLLAHARQRDVISVDFAGPSGASCVAVGKAVVVAESHLVVSLTSMATTTIALARVARVELLLPGKRRPLLDDRRDGPSVALHTDRGGIE